MKRYVRLGCAIVLAVGLLGRAGHGAPGARIFLTPNMDLGASTSLLLRATVTPRPALPGSLVFIQVQVTARVAARLDFIRLSIRTTSDAVVGETLVTAQHFGGGESVVYGMRWSTAQIGDYTVWLEAAGRAPGYFRLARRVATFHVGHTLPGFTPRRLHLPATVPTPVPSVTAPASDIPVPTNIRVEQDDRAAVVQWNAEMRPDRADPPGVTGYRVTWGPASGPMVTVLTAYRVIELQPLVNGAPYVLQVQAVDAVGQLSAPTPFISFTGDPARVAALRTQMTGFFDDFNNPQGPADELKWNSAYSHCDNPALAGFFLNAQFHVHSMVSDLHCDRGQNISRPRAPFDFSGRTGTITFDMDGEQRRDQWYLDLVPGLTDITGQVSIEGGGQNNPGTMLRFHQNQNDVEILYIDASGLETSLAKSTTEWAGLMLVPNVRRHWVLHVSQHHADVQVNGVTIVSTDALNLPFSRTQVLWNAFSYNTAKSNEPAMLLHWDNFGFDGPAPSTVTHNYRDAGYVGGGDFTPVSSGTGSVAHAIQIPDSLAGASSERLLFTQQMDANQWYVWDPSDAVIVNGHRFSLPQPSGAPLPQSSLVSFINPYSTVVDLPVGTLQTGANSVVFSLHASGVLNVHTEIDFPLGAAPAYTQPDGMLGLTMPMAGMPAMADVGPGAAVVAFNGQPTNLQGQLSQQDNAIFTLSGTAAVGLDVSNDIAMGAMGKNPGIARVELWVDGQQVLNLDTTGAGQGVPSPHVVYTYKLDTTQFANGRHELYLKAFNPNGTPAYPDYFDSASQQGESWPVHLNIQN